MKIRSSLSITLTGLMLLTYLPIMGAPNDSALTWEECVKEAATDNRDVLTAEQTVKADEDAHVASLGQFLPQINFNASIGRSGPGGLNDAIHDFSYSPPINQTTSLSLTASQDIFEGFKDFA